MTRRIGINGFGRIGRLTLRSLWPQIEAGQVEIVRINDPGGDAATFAHLLEFDSVHGHWRRDVAFGPRMMSCWWTVGVSPSAAGETMGQATGRPVTW